MSAKWAAAIGASIALLAALISFCLAAEPIAGPVRVIDGDTIHVGDSRIRLFGIDSPERSQTCSGKDDQTYECGRDATAVMQSLVRGKSVACEPKDRDRYGRTVAICSTDAGDIGETMVRQGWAVRYVRYDREGRYTAAEAEAKAAGLGMWSGRFTPPEQWRHNGHRNAQP
jgi:endonuclease YncB( thermonuclease family)